MTTADIVVFDLDNTLADHRHREYLIPGPDMMGYAPNWGSVPAEGEMTP
ncbi:hypothetical protein [Citrobacter braakii]